MFTVHDDPGMQHRPGQGREVNSMEKLKELPKVGKPYKKNDNTFLTISSYKADDYDKKYYNAKNRCYYVHFGNDICGWHFVGRYFKLSKAREAVLNF